MTDFQCFIPSSPPVFGVISPLPKYFGSCDRYFSKFDKNFLLSGYIYFEMFYLNFSKIESFGPTMY